MSHRPTKTTRLAWIGAASLGAWLGLPAGGPAAACAQERSEAPAVVEPPVVVEPPCAAEPGDAATPASQGLLAVRVEGSRLVISQPRPTGTCRLGSLDLPGPVIASAHGRTAAYLTSRGAELWVVDLRQPAQPRLAQRLRTVCALDELVLAPQEDELVAMGPTRQAVHFDVSDPQRVTVSLASLRAACLDPASTGPGAQAAERRDSPRPRWSRRDGNLLLGIGLGGFAGLYLPLLIGNSATQPVNGWYYLPGSPVALGIDVIDKTAKCSGIYCGIGGAIAVFTMAWGIVQVAALSTAVTGAVVLARQPRD